jgi:glycosyltransferase involved in cell wall biosynthesis
VPQPVGAAIVHDFFVQDGGAERCAVEFARMLPTAPIYTSFFNSKRFGDRIDPSRVHAWPMQRLVGPTERFRAFLPLYPPYFSGLRVPADELVLSSSSAFAKAVRTSPKAVHISYVYTPMRYAWDLEGYLHASSYRGPTRSASHLLRPFLQAWDRRTAGRPDRLIAISRVVQDRIKRVWNRDSELIYPPVDVDQIPLSRQDDGFFLVASRLLGYRRIDVAVRACTTLGRRLVVVGDGPERGRLEAMAGPTVTFLGRVDRATLLDQFARCHAYIVPGTEDFGIAPVEAMAAGKPVVALRAGGAVETVDEGVTGVFFDEPSAGSLANAIGELDRTSFDPPRLRERAELFDISVFRGQWLRLFEGLGISRSLYFRP